MSLGAYLLNQGEQAVLEQLFPNETFRVDYGMKFPMSGVQHNHSVMCGVVEEDIENYSYDELKLEDLTVEQAFKKFAEQYGRGLKRAAHPGLLFSIIKTKHIEEMVSHRESSRIFAFGAHWVINEAIWGYYLDAKSKQIGQCKFSTERVKKRDMAMYLGSWVYVPK
jgi:hypothetical protein